MAGSKIHKPINILFWGFYVSKAEEHIIHYITDFLEKSHPAFSGMPICPFARKERLENRLLLQAGSIDTQDPTEELYTQLRTFHHNPDLGTFLYYDPTHRCSLEEAYAFAQKIIDAMQDIKLLAVPIHPEDPFAVQEVRTRGASPFVMMAIQSHQILYEAKEKLKKTAYYDQWEDFEERSISHVVSLVEKREAILLPYWWKPNILLQIQRGEIQPQPIIGSTVDILDRNGIHLWMQRFGTQYGWTAFCSFLPQHHPKIEQHCREGGFVLLTGHGGKEMGRLVYIDWDQNQQTLRFQPPVTESPPMISQYCWITTPEDA